MRGRGGVVALCLALALCAMFSLYPKEARAGTDIAPDGGRVAVGIIQQPMCFTGVLTAIWSPVISLPSAIVLIGNAATLHRGSYAWGVSGIVVGGLHTFFQTLLVVFDSSSSNCGSGSSGLTAIHVLAMLLHVATLGASIVNVVKAHRRGPEDQPKSPVEQLFQQAPSVRSQPSKAPVLLLYQSM